MATRQATLTRTAAASTWSLRTSFGLVVAAQVLLFAGSNLPTPLFPIYEHRYGFGSGVVTLLFSSYVAVLIPALVVLGPVADRVGRRPLIVAGMALTIVSSVGVPRSPQRRVAVRRRDHLRRRQRTRHVVCLDRDTGAASGGPSRRRVAGRIGCHGGRHGSGPSDQWTPRGGDAVAHHVSLRARHRPGIAAHRCPGADT